MKNFTKEECESIRELMTTFKENYIVTKENLEKRNEKEGYKFMLERIEMLIIDPNCLFGTLEEKYWPIALMLFMQLYGYDIDKIDTSKCDAKMIKLLELLCHFGYMDSKILKSSNIN